jgi:5-dehydro-2-deoxygluconokinase
VNPAGRKDIDLITVGRSSVDLYGQQVGGRIEDMGSFAKYVGGCPANIAIGSARLGLRPALLTRVGDDHMGRFLCEQLEREGVDTGLIASDPDRLTALAILGIRDREQFPLLFYRENCADMALTEDDVDEAHMARSRALLITGTHLSAPGVRAASRKAVRLAKAHGARVVLDIDYRPVLWGLTSPEAGENRYVESPEVTVELQQFIADCDLIVGTEEELHILGGTTDTMAAIRRIRERTSAVIVCKRGALGCAAFAGEIGASLDDGVAGASFSIEVFNVLGAGDAFMSGFLRAWLRDRPLQECCTWANACGALVVSRHGCAPASPSWAELRYFLERGSSFKALRKDTRLEHVHWATTRDRDYPNLLILAVDHRPQFEALAAECDAPPERIGRIKQLALESLHSVAAGDGRYGILLDGQYAWDALARASELPYWIGRPIERPGSIPLQFEASADVATEVNEWPLTHTVKCLVRYGCGDPPELRHEQEQALLRLFDACRKTRHELLLEVICPADGEPEPGATAAVMRRFYDIGIYPDWWKLEPSASTGDLEAISAAIDDFDPWCRGVVLLGLSASKEELLAKFSVAARFRHIRGFAVGRTIWSDAARAWLSGAIDDDQCRDRIATRFTELAAGWFASLAAAGRAGTEARTIGDGR